MSQNLSCGNTFNYLIPKIKDELKNSPYKHWDLDKSISINHCHNCTRSECKYDDGVIEIHIFKHETWKLDDYDTFTKISVKLNGKIIYEDDY